MKVYRRAPLFGKMILHTCSGVHTGGLTLKGHIQEIYRRYFFVKEYEDYHMIYIAVP